MFENTEIRAQRDAEKPHRFKNIVATWQDSDLPKWQDHQASIEYLVVGEHRIPVITAPALNDHPHLRVLILTGQHLEETSGPRLALMPAAFSQMRSEGVGFTLFPVVNQVGLEHPENAPEKLLRYNADNVNYNDGWGRDFPSQKLAESVPIEAKIRAEMSQNPYDLIFSLHEDSEHPRQGYFAMYAVPEAVRKQFHERLKDSASSEFYADFTDATKALDGSLDNGHTIIDDQDVGSFENWISDETKTPTILVEAPFGLDLLDRLEFQKKAIELITKQMLEGKGHVYVS